MGKSKETQNAKLKTQNSNLENTVNLGSVEKIPPGMGRCFVVGNAEIAIFRSRCGVLRAVANRCPHRGGPLADGIIGNGVVICPLHAHKFDLDTGRGSEPHECVAVFSVYIENGEILLEPGEDLRKTA